MRKPTSSKPKSNTGQKPKPDARGKAKPGANAPKGKSRPQPKHEAGAKPKPKPSAKPQTRAQAKPQPKPKAAPPAARDDESTGTRLNKFISDLGLCSRREADKLIESGRVKVNGKRAEMGTRITEKDRVYLDGEEIGGDREEAVYLAFHKPVGITCTTETHVKGNIIDYINFGSRIFPIGRLDKPSEGLIFLTNDGDIVNKILRAGNNHEKEYIVTVDKPITQEFIRRMGNGIPMLDTVTQKCFVEQQSKFVFRIILTQGLNRQIRRMCEYLGYEVTRLKRIRIMNISLDRLPEGQWRYLTKAEMNTINNLVAGSTKTEEASVGRRAARPADDME